MSLLNILVPLPRFLTVPLALCATALTVFWLRSTFSVFSQLLLVGGTWCAAYVIWIVFVISHNFPLHTYLFPAQYSYKDIPNLKNRVFLITGANAGLGKSSAKALYRSGAHVIVAVRSLTKGRMAVKEIMEEVPSSEGFLEVEELDLSSLASVAAFAKRVRAKHERLDCLMLNAGIMFCPFTETEDEIESQFAVNHVAHHFLATELLDLLKKSAPSRIVVVASSAHQGASPSRGVALSLKEINDTKTYNQVMAYGQSKLANILFGRELARRVAGDNIFVNIVHPGAVDTELMRNTHAQVPRIVAKIIAAFTRLFFFDSDTAALTQLYTATSPDIFTKKVTGEYFVPLARRQPYFLHWQATDDLHASKLWSFTESILKEKGFR